MRRIIVATDGSPGANRAIDTAVAMAKATGYELVILTIGGNMTGAELRSWTATEAAQAARSGSVIQLKADIARRRQ